MYIVIVFTPITWLGLKNKILVNLIERLACLSHRDCSNHCSRGSCITSSKLCWDHYVGAELVDTFYNLVTDVYEWGWGQSFHFSPALPGEHAQQLKRHVNWLQLGEIGSQKFESAPKTRAITCQELVHSVQESVPKYQHCIFLTRQQYTVVNPQMADRILCRIRYDSAIEPM